MSVYGFDKSGVQRIVDTVRRVEGSPEALRDAAMEFSHAPVKMEVFCVASDHTQVSSGGGLYGYEGFVIAYRAPFDKTADMYATLPIVPDVRSIAQNQVAAEEIALIGQEDWIVARQEDSPANNMRFWASLKTLIDPTWGSPAFINIQRFTPDRYFFRGDWILAAHVPGYGYRNYLGGAVQSWFWPSNSPPYAYSPFAAPPSALIAPSIAPPITAGVPYSPKNHVPVHGWCSLAGGWNRVTVGPANNLTVSAAGVVSINGVTAPYFTLPVYSGPVNPRPAQGQSSTYQLRVYVSAFQKHLTAFPRGNMPGSFSPSLQRLTAEFQGYGHSGANVSQSEYAWASYMGIT